MTQSDLPEPYDMPPSDSRRAADILLICDDEYVCRLLRVVLRDAGYRLAVVSDRETAVFAARGLAPDAILVALELAEAEALEVAAGVRRRAGLPADLPVLAWLTDSPETDDEHVDGDAAAATGVWSFAVRSASSAAVVRALGAATLEYRRRRGASYDREKEVERLVERFNDSYLDLLERAARGDRAGLADEFQALADLYGALGRALDRAPVPCRTPLLPLTTEPGASLLRGWGFDDRRAAAIREVLGRLGAGSSRDGAGSEGVATDGTRTC